MKKFPKLVQCDGRGQIVIPKEIRSDLRIEEGTGFWVYSITGEGILLKKIDSVPLEDEKAIIEELKSKSSKIGLNPKNLERSAKKYRKDKEGKLELI